MSKIIAAKQEDRVWTNCRIAKNTFFGPYRGSILPVIKRIQFLDSPSRPLEEADRVEGTEYDLLDGDFSWLCQVNPARYEDEQNTEAIRAPDDQIYFRARTDIAPGQELRVWLSPSLAAENGVYHISDEEVKGQQYTCRKCTEKFQFSRALSAHKAIGCGRMGSNPNNHGSPSSEMSHALESNETLTPDIGEYFRKKRPLERSQVTQNRNEDRRADFRESIVNFRSLDHRCHYDGPEVKDRALQSYGPEEKDRVLQSSSGFASGRVLSNPKLASLISSFSWPRLRRMNESQSLAEYHKQEFRKKFQGNEHYLRRHLYREITQKKTSARKRYLALALREEGASQLGNVGERQRVKEEKNTFLRCFGDDRRMENENNTELFSDSESEIYFHSDEEGRTSGYQLQDDETELGGFSKPDTEFMGSTTLQTSFTSSSNRGSKQDQHVGEEHFARDATDKCTCHHDKRVSHEPPNGSGREINLNEDLPADDGRNVVTCRREELNPSDSSSKEIGNFMNLRKHGELSSFNSHFLYQKMHQVDPASLRQQPPCCCFPTSGPHYDPTENVSRFREPAFFMNPLYRYSTYPRMFPFMAAHQAPHSPQTAPRNQGFTCEYCGKVYCRKYVLKIHMRTHTGFKPLRCKVCDKSFSDPSNMKKHVKLHETEDTVHRCRHCGRNFVRYRGLLNHIKSKHSEHVAIDSL